MVRIVGVSGSLRRGSLNTKLLRAAVEHAPDGTEIVIGQIRGVPLYDGDVEQSDGVPDAVVALKTAVREADGLLLVTPEYNSGIPGVFKNAIDWMSRPPSDIAAVFGGRPVGLIGASPGGFGTVLAQNAWLPVLRKLGCEVWSGEKLAVAKAGGVFDDEGRLTDETARGRLTKYLAGFAKFVAGRSAPS